MNVVINIERFILTILFANFASKELYGFYSYIIAILGILSFASFPGITNSYIREVRLDNKEILWPLYKQRLTYSFLGSLVVVAILLFNSSNGFFAILIGIVYAFRFSNEIYIGYFQGQERFKELILIMFASNTASTILCAISVILEWQNEYVIISFIVPEVIVTGFVLVWILRRLRIPNNKRELIANVIKYGRRLTYINIIGYMILFVDKFLLGTILDLEQVAIYSIIILFPDFSKVLYKNTTSILYQRFIGISAAKRKLVLLITIMLSFAVFTILVYHIVAKYIFQILFIEYQEYVSLSLLYAVSMFEFSSYPIPAYLEANKLEKTLYISNLTSNTLQLVIVIVSVVLFGLIGIVVGKLVARTLNFLIRMLILWLVI